ncbi:MAG: aquaporin family protein [Bacteroidales bacterium]|nr:aquaporin family protein [Candidatus Cryptobacteroides faecihippi]
MNPYLAEFLGTLVLILIGDGVCACTSLEGSKGKGGGWVVVTLAWGLAVMCGVFIAGPYSGAHLNPAVSIGLAIAGSLAWSMVPGFIIAQMAGGFCGALLVYAFYKDHYDATACPDTKIGTFCTMPAIEGHKLRNLFCEAVATWLLLFSILMFSAEGNEGLSEIGPLPVTMLIMAIGMALGGATGYAINPARDLAPRLAHAIVPFKSQKRDSGWAYSWVPVAGPVIGAAAAAACYLIIF